MMIEYAYDEKNNSIWDLLAFPQNCLHKMRLGHHLSCRRSPKIKVLQGGLEPLEKT